MLLMEEEKSYFEMIGDFGLLRLIFVKFDEEGYMF
jgi:hypothetical protein